ncbi:MAG: serine hydrolase [Kiritimatiellae bacterium]|nr:serine hydrolase [Kiritimatiellia bacterium]
MKWIIFAAAIVSFSLFGATTNTTKRVAHSMPEPKNVPELLVTAKGEKVTTVAAWEKTRRPELLRTFETELYGVRPQVAPKLKFETVAEDANAVDGTALLKRVKITYAGPYGERDFVATAFFPKNAKGPSPVFVYIAFPRDGINSHRSTGDAQELSSQLEERWPVKKMINRGFATVAFRSTDVADDDIDGFNAGVYPILQKPTDRTETSWGAISAWAWGASRVADWLMTEPLADKEHLAVVGLSRLGKAALWAGATDTRFALTCSVCSGCCGAKLNHIELDGITPGYGDEHIERILRFRHWFPRSFDKYRGKDLELPFDQHQLIALCAPRLVSISSASDDPGAGPLAEYWAARLASPAWELYGKKGLISREFPMPERLQDNGSISYHIRKGPHGLVYSDWERFMTFADDNGWTKGTCGGGRHAFLQRMAEKAAALGMKTAHFENPSGLTKFSRASANDLLKLGMACAHHPVFTNIWSKTNAQIQVKGPHARTITLRHNYTELAGWKRFSEQYPFLGGKGGSLAFTDLSVRAHVIVTEIEGSRYVFSISGMKSNKEDPFALDLEIAASIKAQLHGEKMPETPLLDAHVNYGGAYAWSSFDGKKSFASKNADTPHVPASTSKMMTALCALDAANGSTAPVIVRKSDLTGGSGIRCYEGDEFKFEDALIAMILSSSNTLAETMARH